MGVTFSHGRALRQVDVVEVEEGYRDMAGSTRYGRSGARRAVVAALVLATALLVGAAGTRSPVSPISPPPAPPSATAIPWTTATPPLAPTPVGAPVGARPCHAAALTAADLGTSALTGGQLATGIGVGNRSAVACTLFGVPVVDLLDGQGRPLPRRQDTAAGFGGPLRRVVLPPGLGPLRPGFPTPGQPAIDIFWRVNGAGGFACVPAPPVAVAVRVVLPAGGGSLTVPVTRIAPCGSQIGVTGFQDVVAPAPATPVYPLSVRLRLPATALAGQPLRYAVVLTNAGTMPVRFHAGCPAYREVLVVSAGPPGARRGIVQHRYLLNCGAVRAVAPGARVAFAMVLDIPAWVSPGVQTLAWALDHGALPVKAGGKVPLRIVRSPGPTRSLTITSCRVSGVRVSAAWDHAAAYLEGTVTISDRTAAPCGLAGGDDNIPPVALLDARGRRLPLQPPAEPRAIAPLGVGIQLLPGHPEHFSFVWRNWCHPVPTALTISTALPTDRWPPVSLPVRAEAPPCAHASQPSTIEAYPLDG